MNAKSSNSSPEFPGLACALGALLVFAGLAYGAHDAWAAAVVYTGVAVLLSLYLMMGQRGGLPFHLSLALPLLLIIGVFLLSFLNSANLSESRLELYDWAASLAVFVLALNIVRTERDWRVVLAFLVPFFWIQLGLNVGQIRHEMGTGRQIWDNLTGSLLNSNFQAAFVVLWLPSLAAEAWRTKKVYWWSGALAALVVLALSASLLAWLVLGAGLILSVGKDRLGRWFQAHPRLVTGLALAVVALALGAVAWKLSRLGITAQGVTTQSASNRLYWWGSALWMFRDHPLTGIGLGNFASAYLAYRLAPIENTLYAHSFWFGLLAETGILGTGAVLFFLSAWGRRIWSGWRSGVRAPAVLGAVLFLVLVSVGIGPELLAILLSFAFVLGAAIAPAPQPSVHPRRSLRIVGAAAALAAIPFALSPFYAGRNLVDGRMFLKARDWEAADKHFMAAIRLDDGWEGYHGRAQVAVLKNPEDLVALRQAIGLEQAAIERNRFNGSLWFALGWMQKASGNEAVAKESFGRAVRYQSSLTEAVEAELSAGASGTATGAAIPSAKR